MQILASSSIANPAQRASVENNNNKNSSSNNNNNNSNEMSQANSAVSIDYRAEQITSTIGKNDYALKATF